MKTLALTVCLTTIISFISINCLARNSENSYTARGGGIDSCGEMSANIQNNEFNTEVYKSYLAGFVIGYNLGRMGKVDFFEDENLSSMYNYVMKYCEDNPSEILVRVIEELILEYNDTIN